MYQKLLVLQKSCCHHLRSVVYPVTFQGFSYIAFWCRISCANSCIIYHTINIRRILLKVPKWDNPQLKLFGGSIDWKLGAHAWQADGLKKNLDQNGPWFSTEKIVIKMWEAPKKRSHPKCPWSQCSPKVIIKLCITTSCTQGGGLLKLP